MISRFHDVTLAYSLLLYTSVDCYSLSSELRNIGKATELGLEQHHGLNVLVFSTTATHIRRTRESPSFLPDNQQSASQANNLYNLQLFFSLKFSLYTIVVNR